MRNTLLLLVLLVLGKSVFAQKERFTVEHLWKLKRLSGTTISPDEKWLFYQTASYDVAANSGKTTGFLVNLATGTTETLLTEGSGFYNVIWDRSNVLWWLRPYGENTELYRLNPVENKAGSLEFTFPGEVEGLTFSPDGSHIAALQPVKLRKTIADIYPDLTKTQARIEDDLMYRHWNHWQGESGPHLFLYEKAGGNWWKAADVMEGELFASVTPPFSGIEEVTFSADGKTVYYATKKSTGKTFATSTNTQIYAYSIAQKTTVCLTEGREGYDTHPRISPDGKKLLYLSMERSGFEADKNRIILHDLASEKETDLTASIDVSVSDFVWNAKGNLLYFIAPVKGTKQVFELEIASGKIRQLTHDRADILSVHPLKDKLIAERQSMLAPTDIWTINAKNGTQTQYSFVNKALMDSIALPEVREKWVTTTDGKKMLVWMILPPQFDETKSYPALLYCQGGPQSMVSQFFSYRWNFLLMASHGYVVMAPNRRGLPGFGQEWNDAISRDWGGQAMRDYLVTVDSLSALPFIDENRLGAVGASYGGYSVYYLAGIHNNRFKAFVSHCGLFNLESWYGTTEELFFANHDIGGPYWKPENKELYEKNSPHRLVANWNTPMLVIHGGKDFRVPESEGMQAFQVLQLKGIPSKYLYFPDEGHWITKPQNGVLWYRTYFNWLDSYLK